MKKESTRTRQNSVRTASRRGSVVGHKQVRPYALEDPRNVEVMLRCGCGVERDSIPRQGDRRLKGYLAGLDLEAIMLHLV
jgi:hypothetical protein